MTIDSISKKLDAHTAENQDSRTEMKPLINEKFVALSTLSEKTETSNERQFGQIALYIWRAGSCGREIITDMGLQPREIDFPGNHVTSVAGADLTSK
jgi:hypothetical protein